VIVVKTRAIAIFSTHLELASLQVPVQEDRIFQLWKVLRTPVNPVNVFQVPIVKSVLRK
jgi:hypothetical protein